MPKINQLNSKTVPSNNDEFPFHDPNSGTTRKITRGDFIGGAPLPPDSVDTQAIADGSVTSEKIDFATIGLKADLLGSGVSGTTGNKTIEVGFRPRIVRFVVSQTTAANSARTGQGVATSGFQRATATIAAGSSASVLSVNNRCVHWLDSGLDTGFEASFVGMTDTGFTINVNKASTAVPIWYEAEQ